MRNNGEIREKKDIEKERSNIEERVRNKREERYRERKK